VGGFLLIMSPPQLESVESFLSVYYRLLLRRLFPKLLLVFSPFFSGELTSRRIRSGRVSPALSSREKFPIPHFVQLLRIDHEPSSSYNLFVSG